MKRQNIFLVVLLTFITLAISFIPLSIGQEGRSGSQGSKSVLIVYHGGVENGNPAPPLDQTDVDALTHATTKDVNVKVIASGIRDRLTVLGYRVDIVKAVDVQGPQVFLNYDGIIFGTPTWFSNVAYPIKKIFDEHIIRIYAHRPGRLNDKALSGFTTVMEQGQSGPRCLEALTWGMEHLSKNVVNGMVINTGDNAETWNAAVQVFCDRFSEALKK